MSGQLYTHRHTPHTHRWNVGQRRISQGHFCFLVNISFVGWYFLSCVQLLANKMLPGGTRGRGNGKQCGENLYFSPPASCVAGLAHKVKFTV